MRSNLLSLQNISRQVSSTQNKLATGNKVNSAIDNPSSYYTARSLNNRADDLNALLDSMGQAVSTIKAATTALEAGADFLEQAAAVATSALETATVPAKSYFADKGTVVTTAQELKDAVNAGKETIIVYGKIDYFENENITLKAGQKLVGTEYFTGYSGREKFSQINFMSENPNTAINMEDKTLISDLNLNYHNNNIHHGGSLISLAESGKYAAIHNVDLNLKRLDIGDAGSSHAVIYANGGATIDISGRNRIEASGYYVSGTYAMAGSTINYLDGSTTDISLPDNFNGGGFGVYTWRDSTTNIASGATLNIKSNARGGIGILDKSVVNIDGKVNIDIKAITENIYNRAFSLWGYDSYGGNSLNIAASAILNIKSSVDDWLFNGGNAGTNGPNTIKFEKGARVNGFYNGVEQNFVSSGYNYTNAATTDQKLLLSSLDSFSGFSVSSSTAGIDWNQIVKETDPKSEKNNFTQYNQILSQYDQLIKDASYKGINLLQGDKLNVKFNESGSAALEVEGRDMSSAVLGLSTVDWQTQGDIAQSLKEISAALKSIRSFSAELGNNYSIITSRQDFTENLINILTEGADKLTLADMNEESANMLALQTRQQLAINSLSLASQASQAVLKLF